MWGIFPIIDFAETSVETNSETFEAKADNGKRFDETGGRIEQHG